MGAVPTRSARGQRSYLSELIDRTREIAADSNGVLHHGFLHGDSDSDGLRGTPTGARQRSCSITGRAVKPETTASQLAWAFQLLAHNPIAQARLIAEVDRDDGEEYLTATIQEVMRHRPVFLFTIPRAVVKPVEIGEWTYRPPARLLGCTYLLHHDPSIYPEPNRFHPERFLDAPPPPHLWLPWGGGRRRAPACTWRCWR